MLKQAPIFQIWDWEMSIRLIKTWINTRVLCPLRVMNMRTTKRAGEESHTTSVNFWKQESKWAHLSRIQCSSMHLTRTKTKCQLLRAKPLSTLKFQRINLRLKSLTNNTAGKIPKIFKLTNQSLRWTTPDTSINLFKINYSPPEISIKASTTRTNIKEIQSFHTKRKNTSLIRLNISLKFLPKRQIHPQTPCLRIKTRRDMPNAPWSTCPPTVWDILTSSKSSTRMTILNQDRMRTQDRTHANHL